MHTVLLCLISALKTDLYFNSFGSIIVSNSNSLGSGETQEGLDEVVPMVTEVRSLNKSIGTHPGRQRLAQIKAISHWANPVSQKHETVNPETDHILLSHHADWFPKCLWYWSVTFSPEVDCNIVPSNSQLFTLYWYPKFEGLTFYLAN